MKEETAKYTREIPFHLIDILLLSVDADHDEEQHQIIMSKQYTASN